jgi:hypothetical protein
MGLEDGWVCDAVDGRSHQLRILGNGVVPQQAAYAISLLAGEPLSPKLHTCNINRPLTLDGHTTHSGGTP